MKKRTLLFFMFFIPIISMYAGTTFYVNPTSPSANDLIDGTSVNSPWLSLNPTKWVDGCVVILSEGIHTVLEKAWVRSNVTLQGSSKVSTIIEGLSEDDILRGSTSPQFFQIIETGNLTVKNITLRNFVSNEDFWGGMFNVDPDATLSLENVDIMNASLPKRGGAAISSSGTLICKNMTISNCVSSHGGAISIFGKGLATFDNVIFSKNSTVNGTDRWKDGGAVSVLTKTSDVSFNGCFFDSNVCDDDGTDYRQPSGGAIAYRIYAGGTQKFKVTNSTFYNNFAQYYGGAIEIAKSGSGNIDFSFTNNIFFRNNLRGLWGTVFHFSGWDDATISGKISFANNTFFQNGPITPTDSKSSMAIWDLAIDFSFVNNIMCNPIFNAAEGREFGDDLAFFTQDIDPNTLNYKSITIKGNTFKKNGGWHTQEIEDMFNGPDNKIAGNDEIKLDTELTFPTVGVPYLKINNASSVAIDKGINELFIGSTNIVPTLDIRGQAMVGTSKDAGAYEYDGISAINDLVDKLEIFAYPNPFKDVLNLSKVADKVSIIDVAGATLISEFNVSSINTSKLNHGVYLMRIVNSDGKISNLKIQK